jgi:hypothetical protein
VYRDVITHDTTTRREGVNMDGIFIARKRPQSKKAVKDAVRDIPELVRIENTSLHSGGYDGPVSELPLNKPVHFVGPDPYSNRKFYGTIRRTEKGIKVT